MLNCVRRFRPDRAIVRAWTAQHIGLRPRHLLHMHTPSTTRRSGRERPKSPTPSGTRALRLHDVHLDRQRRYRGTTRYACATAGGSAPPADSSSFGAGTDTVPSTGSPAVGATDDRAAGAGGACASRISSRTTFFVTPAGRAFSRNVSPDHASPPAPLCSDGAARCARRGLLPQRQLTLHQPLIDSLALIPRRTNVANASTLGRVRRCSSSWTATTASRAALRTAWVTAPNSHW